MFTLAICVHVCYQSHVQPITLSCMLGYENYLTQRNVIEAFMVFDYIWGNTTPVCLEHHLKTLQYDFPAKHTADNLN